MPDVTITIPTPTITAPEHFAVRYRLLPAGAWVVLANQTNAPFTITGLAPGQYELEVTFTKADGTACPATSRTFTVLEECPCLEVTEAYLYVPNLDIPVIKIYYTYTGTPPACGWWVIYSKAGSPPITLHYTTLPASPILINAVKADYHLRVIADCCNGRQHICFDEDIPTTTQPCIPLSGLSAVIHYVGGVGWEIVLTFTQSNPATTSFTIPYTEAAVNTGIPEAGTIVVTNAGSLTQITIPLHPNFDTVIPYTLDYTGTIVDACGHSTKWAVHADLS